MRFRVAVERVARLLPFVSFSLIFIPVVAAATSGACSGHLGINCSAGPGAYGQVICNDGWHGSSVSYASMEECQASQPSLTSVCTPPALTGCTEQSEYTQLQNLCAQEQTQADSYCAVRKPVGFSQWSH